MSSATFMKRLVILNASIPMGLLAWDYWNNQLGANAVNVAIHITGIVSLILLLLSLLITPLIKWTKQQDWFACRKAFGLFGFFYAVAHLGLYFIFDRQADISSTYHEVTTRRFLQVGSIAFVLLLPLAFTSQKGMRQWLGIKPWKRLHRLAYLIATLAVLHYYLQVKSDTRSPIAFAVVLTALLATRIPKTSFFTNSQSIDKNKKPAAWNGKLRLISIRQESHLVRTFRFANIDTQAIPFEFRAGQFISIRLQIESQIIRRSYTIASSPSQRNWIELTIKREEGGLASNYLHDHAKIGDCFTMRGPFGKFTFDPDSTDQILLLAGGVGITPIMSILRDLHDRDWRGDIQAVISAQQECDLLFTQELRDLENSSLNLTVQTTLTRNLDDSWNGQTGRINADLIQTIITNRSESHVFLCGPNTMAEDLSKIFRGSTISAENIHIESFGGKSRPSADQQGYENVNYLVEFAQSKQEAAFNSHPSLLDLAESMNVPIEYECRAGICGQCKVKLLQGEVSMGCTDGLTDEDKKLSNILACQAIAKSNLVVKA